MATGCPRSGRYLPEPGSSRAAKSIKMSPIGAEVARRPPHGSYQPRLFRMFECRECSVFDRELALDLSANQVGLPPSTAMSGSLQPLPQFSRKAHGNAMGVHILV